MPLETLIILECIIFTAAFVQGLVGFGSSLIAVPSLLILLEDAKVIAPLLTLCGLVINIRLVTTLWSHCRLDYLIPLVLGALGGIPLGILVLEFTPIGILKWGLVILIVSYTLYSFWKPDFILPGSNWWGTIVGFIAGCFGSALNLNGPVLAVWGSVKAWEKEEFRSNLSAYFGITGIISLAAYSISGLMTFTVWQDFFYAVPAVVVGTFLGDYLSEKIKPERFKQMIKFLLIILAGLVIVSQRSGQ